MEEDSSVVTDQRGDMSETLRMLRAAIVFEKRERTEAPYEAKLAAEKRIETAHRTTIQMVREARAAGATKTMIAQQLGVQNLYRVNQLIKEAEES